MLTYQEDEGLEVTLKLAHFLRLNNCKVVTSLESLKFKKVFPLAEKKGAKFVTLIGSEEIQNNKIQIKNLATKEQLAIDINDKEAILKLIKG